MKSLKVVCTCFEMKGLLIKNHSVCSVLHYYSYHYSQKSLNSHVHGYFRMRFVTDHFKVINTEILDVVHFSFDDYLWPGFWFSLELSFERLHVVEINMGVPESVDKVSGSEITDVSDHHGEEGVAGDVEGNPQAQVCRPLVELAGQLPVSNIELDQAVTGRQGHLVQVRGVPGAHDDPPVVGLGLDPLDDLRELVDPLAAVVGVHVHVLSTEVSPLKAVDGTEVSLLTLCKAQTVQELSASVPVPDPHFLLLQLLGVGGAPDEPEELLSNAAIEDFLGGQQGEGSIPQRKSHLSSEG